MPMTFPGDNSITLNEQAVHELIKHGLANLGISGVRIKETRLGSYPTRLIVEFTSDPATSPIAYEPEPATSLASDTLPATY